MRPSWFGAWGVVAIDAVFVVLYHLIFLRPYLAWVNETNPATWWIVVTAFLCFFIPANVVLIVSSTWAAKSRWADMDTPQ